MKRCRSNVGKVQLYSKPNSVSGQWVRLHPWHWKPQPNTYDFRTLDMCPQLEKGPFPHVLTPSQRTNLKQMYSSLIPYTDWLDILKEDGYVERNIEETQVDTIENMNTRTT